MKKVLYISYDGMTDPLGQSQVLPYLRELAKEGYQFTIISFEKEARLSQEGAVIRSLAKEAGISWEPLIFTAKPPVLSKMYDRYRMRRKAEQLYQQEKFDLIHCRSYVAAEVGLWLKQKYGVKMLFDMRGFWADEKVDNGQWPLSNWLYKRIYRHYKQEEKEFLLHADGIISLTQNAKDYLLAQPVYNQPDITVIPCCADLDHFDYKRVSQAEIDQARHELGIPSTARVLTYLGSIGGWYLTKEMFRFYKQLSDRYPDYVILLLTKDSPETVRAEAADAGIAPDKLFITYSSRKQLPVYLAATSLSLFFIRDSFSKKASSPTKHGELMGMGIPVICNAIGDTGYIIDATKTGIVLNEFDLASMQKAVDQLPSLQQLGKDYIRQCAYQYFDLAEGVRRYQSVYDSIFQPKTKPAIHA